jgi:hypothetical protein
VAVNGLIRAVAGLLTGRGVEPEFSAQGAKAIDPLRTRAGLEAGRTRFALSKRQHRPEGWRQGPGRPS